ncbi:MAG: sigma-70 family RNA polymerase sigma factor [Phycisphaera sp.]|nr:sigma-70 family RNA polymerase sigma factor [Phycisphaera sp.]
MSHTTIEPQAVPQDVAESGATPADDPRSDLELVDAINSGDPAAFDALYLRYRDWVLRLAWRFTRDHDAAGDVLQDTFTYVLRKFPGFALTARFTTFLYPVVRHVAIANQKKARRMILDDGQIDQPAEPDPPSADTQRRQLASVMACLSEDHREAVLLRFVDGFSLAEIAEAVGVPVGTVKSRLHHAIKALRDDPATQRYFEQ